MRERERLGTRRKYVGLCGAICSQCPPSFPPSLPPSLPNSKLKQELGARIPSLPTPTPSVDLVRQQALVASLQEQVKRGGGKAGEEEGREELSKHMLGIYVHGV